MKITKNNTLTAVFVFICSIVVLGTIKTALAGEPLPQNVTDTQKQIQKRIESISTIDGQMKPIKENLAHLQRTRDLLDEDLREDAKRLQRWGYKYDWETGDVTPLDLKAIPSK